MAKNMIIYQFDRLLTAKNATFFKFYAVLFCF